jgi:feruloyl esterase
LSKLKRRGTKLLQYHGWTDAPIPPRMSLDYFASVQQRMGDTSGFHRLFMVPGMNHCGGGEGPWQVDWLAVLERWVEQGQAPSELSARHPQNGATQLLRAQR